MVAEFPPEKQAAGRSPLRFAQGRFFTVVVNLEQSRSRFGGMLLSRGYQQRTFDDDRQNNGLRNGSCVACRHRIFIAPATAQNAPMPQHRANISSSHSRQLFMSAVAEYDAGLRRGTANSSRDAYLRGFSDGTSSEAYSARGYAVNSEPETPTPSVSGYSSDDRNAGYYMQPSGYSYDGRYSSYGNDNASITDRYDTGYAPQGLMNVAVAPVMTVQAPDPRIALRSYCTARYRSFDPASGTFLADDGNRYFCR
jgi:hypothetical protein